MAKFVEIEHEGIEATARVPESSVAHYKKAGWKLVAQTEADSAPALPEGDPSLEWTRPQLDAYAARRLSLDTSDERTKGDVLATIQAAIAAQPDNNTETPATGAENEES